MAGNGDPFGMMQGEYPGARDSPDLPEPDIQTLLDRGYEQLDGFAAWLEEGLGQDARTVQRDCFNAETLIDYLANHQHKAASDIDEFELRWYLFSYYIRKVQADPITEEMLPDSLHRFFTYLQNVGILTTPYWVWNVLEDRALYMKRRRDYATLDAEDERLWQEGFRMWCEEIEEELDARCLWLPNEMGQGMVWNDVAGWREATLREQARRLWQQERAALQQDGLHFDAMRGRLLGTYQTWMDTPQDRLDGNTPREIIVGERQGQDIDWDREQT